MNVNVGYAFKSATADPLLLKLPYDLVCPRVVRWVGRSVGRSVIISLKGGKFRLYAPIGELVILNSIFSYILFIFYKE